MNSKNTTNPTNPMNYYGLCFLTSDFCFLISETLTEGKYEVII